jgi:hypothetical protein
MRVNPRIPRTVARFAGSSYFLDCYLGLTPQATCFHPLRGLQYRIPRSYELRRAVLGWQRLSHWQGVDDQGNRIAGVRPAILRFLTSAVIIAFDTRHALRHFRCFSAA